MAYADKAVLLSSMSAKMGEEIPAVLRDKVLEILSAELDGYEMTRISAADAGKDDLLDVYLSAMRIQGRSEKTIARYEYAIRRLMDHLSIHTRSVTVYHLRQYLAQEKARGIGDSTLEGMRQIYSAYFNWLQRENLITINPTANLGAIKCAKKIKTTCSDVDLERLKLACNCVRDRAIITFLASTGCRISEVTGLDRADVDLNHLECTVLGKGNKERTVYLDAVAGMTLREYLNKRTDMCPALFAGRMNERLTAQGMRCMLNKTAERAVVTHIHPHKFRRTLATNLIRHGMPIQDVASILGHDKLDTTMKYVVLNKTDVENAYRRYA